MVFHTAFTLGVLWYKFWVIEWLRYIALKLRRPQNGNYNRMEKIWTENRMQGISFRLIGERMMKTQNNTYQEQYWI